MGLLAQVGLVRLIDGFVGSGWVGPVGWMVHLIDGVVGSGWVGPVDRRGFIVAMRVGASSRACAHGLFAVGMLGGTGGQIFLAPFCITFCKKSIRLCGLPEKG